ncbi:2-succinyl-5-enolpyruvyl-6-hydroxy-3-cyclohexene-1-carboxylic-acid synthase [Gloeocapsa sp. PCC 73106]|uniref:2-succinyl-5-enolpyruvyl-6-hydroxy-3- cyclohexene-1-carboxylic-acid synthase n=1 Tax=Gloeocapsa sp. PCC 73106 TaxID=102232 RepID=UPI0002AB9FD7|nr:2-succinyl-5-enolpyruvyl-6-hydroxy-3-cyclohexene-1-carboxylic-acid synthase [Gloeocapsa sp. PCC 73106]ELR97866.1 2-succinyl-5-enolpyruvyl-6-hydroxy-3-cyclohexene-1-carboxylic-acid synthase [Gloeocapsa sp. PCC 73106]
MLDHRNLNTLWASIIVETLFRLGLKIALISPGSRSTPLTMAFAQHQKIETIVILDERSAAFFALGKSKQLGLPVALVCTSGTAGANFYPAIIEARYSQVPLLVFTADRPRELQDCRAGQTIDQVRLYGNYPNWQTELAIPEADLFLSNYLRETLIQAWERSLFPTPGVVHLNCPFREPLAPIKVTHSLEIPPDFFSDIQESYPLVSSCANFAPPTPWLNCERGIIIAGLAQPQQPELYCQAIARLSLFLGWPVLAEALSPLRNYAQINPYLISTYDFCLRYTELASKLRPELVIQLGELPTSKELRQWLAKNAPKRWIITPTQENLDPLRSKTIYIRAKIEQLSFPLSEKPISAYLQLWLQTEIKARKILDQALASEQNLYEGKVSWLLSQHLPFQTPVFIANSMSVRYAEFFWVPGNSHIVPYFNRGANGIDGTLSTALGIAHRQQSSVLLTGDLALLHDTNGFLSRDKFKGHLTIVLINNQGGGIFSYLPVAEYTSYFEEFFATPQHIDFASLCQTYKVEYHLITSWESLGELLNPLPERGIRLLELPCDRTLDSQWLDQISIIE